MRTNHITNGYFDEKCLVVGNGIGDSKVTFILMPLEKA